MDKKEWTLKNKKKNLILWQPPTAIRKPSHLIKQVYSNLLTTNQKKLYNFLLRELLKNDKNTLETNRILVKRKSIAEFLQVKKYHDLDSDLYKIMRTVINVEDEKHRTRATLISSYTMPKDLFDDEADGQNIVIRFDTKLTKTFKEIENYITMNFNELQALTNTHAVSLYEIFKRGLNGYESQRLNLSAIDLRKFLNIEDNQYSAPYDFEKYVIKKAIKEINLNTDIDITYERIKVAKGEYEYKFRFNQYIEMTPNAFSQVLREKGYYKSIQFTLNDKEYRWQGIDKKTGEYALDIYDKSCEILLIDARISDDKILGVKRNYYDNKETISGEKAEEIYNTLYDIFLTDKAYIFIYKLFILENFDTSKNIKSLEDIPEQYWDFIEEYVQFFTK
jgi:plasmid replication initiation protein